MVAALVPWGIDPLLANVGAFITAFQVSYWGHRGWTFRAGDQRHGRTLPRFVLVSGGSFLLNEALYYILLRYTSLDYRLSLLIVLVIVAALTYILSRQWAFRTV